MVRLFKRLDGARAMGSAADRRRSGDEHARPVHWQEAMVAADERDARLAIEMPPGGVLTCLTRQAGWRGETIALERSGLDVARHLAQRLSD